jgi:ABC-type xylose transport system permease subunit
MVKKNTSIELAVALIKGMAYMLCILVCNVPSFIVSLIGGHL